MRYLVFLVIHLISVAAVLAPIVLFAVPSFASQLPYTGNGLFLGLAIYWFFVPCAIGVIAGVAIDWLHRKANEKNYYSEIKWSKTRRRVVVLSFLGAAMMYVHFLLQPTA